MVKEIVVHVSSSDGFVPLPFPAGDAVLQLSSVTIFDPIVAPHRAEFGHDMKGIFSLILQVVGPSGAVQEHVIFTGAPSRVESSLCVTGKIDLRFVCEKVSIRLKGSRVACASIKAVVTGSISCVR